jgi:hypothetical protein
VQKGREEAFGFHVPEVLEKDEDKNFLDRY